MKFAAGSRSHMLIAVELHGAAAWAVIFVILVCLIAVWTAALRFGLDCLAKALIKRNERRSPASRKEEKFRRLSCGLKIDGPAVNKPETPKRRD